MDWIMSISSLTWTLVRAQTRVCCVWNHVFWFTLTSFNACITHTAIRQCCQNYYACVVSCMSLSVINLGLGNSLNFIWPLYMSSDTNTGPTKYYVNYDLSTDEWSGPLGKYVEKPEPLSCHCFVKFDAKEWCCLEDGIEKEHEMTLGYLTLKKECVIARVSYMCYSHLG